MTHEQGIPPPLTDEEIQAAAVGDLPEYNATIQLAEYDRTGRGCTSARSSESGKRSG